MDEFIKRNAWRINFYIYTTAAFGTGYIILSQVGQRTAIVAAVLLVVLTACSKIYLDRALRAAYLGHRGFASTADEKYSSIKCEVCGRTANVHATECKQGTSDKIVRHFCVSHVPPEFKPKKSD